MNYDLIVAGAGPAGSITAAVVAQAGYRVLVLERDASCRSPCAGYISSTINIELPDGCIIQSRIRKMRTYFPDLSFHDFQLSGFLVDRPSFDMALATKAEDSGAEIRWKSPLIDLAAGGVRFRDGEASGKIIVGADGVFSRVAALLGLERQRVAFCAQYHIRGIELLPEPDTCEIFFDANYAPGGYVWIYPAGNDSAKVGLGITGAGTRSPHEYLDAFVSESPLAERLCGAVAGLLPEREVQELLLYGRPPVDITPAEFRRLIGPVRHHQYLNYFYGITVEEALFCAVRDEVRKERWAAGLSHDRDPSAEAYRRIYRRERDELLGTFRRERRYRQLKSTTLLEMKEFTYWLFRYRLKNSDPARVASDTRKGLDWLARQGRPMYPAPR